MSRSLFLPVLAVCAAGFVSSSIASAQAKVAVINFQKAILETAEIKKASTDMQAKFKPRQDALEKAQRELSDIQPQLTGEAGKISPAGQADSQARAQRRQKEATRVSEDLQAEVDRELNDVLQRAGASMT